MPAPQRTRILFRYRQVLEDHLDELAAPVTLEHRKALEEARGSVPRGVEAVEFACGISTLMMGESLENVVTGVDSVWKRNPSL